MTTLIREENLVKDSVRRKGCLRKSRSFTEADGSLPGSKRSRGFSVAFPATQSGASSFHVFSSSNSKAHQEDKGAGEDLGLQRFE